MKKDLKVYCAHSNYTNEEILLGIYHTKDAALRDLIDALNIDCDANITEYTEEALDCFINSDNAYCKVEYGFGHYWYIKEETVSDKERILEVI